MDRNFGMSIVGGIIAAIAVFTIGHWLFFERLRHRRAIRSAVLRALGREAPKLDDDELNDDPYDVGMNDKDIL